MNTHEDGYSARESFDTADLDYELPADLIAQHPAATREGSRLLVVDRGDNRLHDARIDALHDWLEPGDLLVLNDTKVLPAKFSASRKTGGIVTGLFIEELAQGTWRVMLRGSRRLDVGETLVAAPDEGDGVRLELQEAYGQGQWRVTVDPPGDVEEVLGRIGQTPLPPYIHRDVEDPSCDVEDRLRYQTVYAEKPGAIAAPTAGLHLTHSLLDRLADRGVARAFVTLHVGLGTFKPVSVDNLRDHVMHGERYELPEVTAEAVRACRRRGGRVVAVGTTCVRVLESAARRTRLDAVQEASDGRALGETGTSARANRGSMSKKENQPESEANRVVECRRGSTELLIYPPYRFGVVDALLTNFHLPRSTLLALVMAFAGVDPTRRAYRHAVDQSYRFYSFGDAMLIR